MGIVWRENIVYKIVAISLAFLLWLYVTAGGNPPIERNFTLNIEYINLRDDLVLVERVKTVDIKVRAEQKVIVGIGPNDFRATVDATGVEIGTQNLPVRITGPTGSEITDIYPREARIYTDRVAEKQVPVRVALLGQTAHGYSSFKATVKPSHVVLRGPANFLDTIVDARVDVNLESAHTNLVLNLPIKVQDQWGNFYGPETFNMSPNTVEVFVPVIKDTPSKTVPIRPNLEGRPAQGYQISRIVLEPDTVQILGTFNTLEAIDAISTTPINIAGISENIVREVELVTPTGVTLSYGAKVKVIIQVEATNKQRTLDVEIETRNLKEGQEVVINQKTAKVRVDGLIPEVDRLTAKDLTAYIDLAGLAPGKHEVKVQVTSPQGIEVQSIEPTKVQVEIPPQI